MIRLLRKVPGNYYGFLTSLVGISAGLRMVNPERKGNTWLCFDGGCVTVQGYTVLVISMTALVWLIVLEVRRQRRMLQRKLQKLRPSP